MSEYSTLRCDGGCGVEITELGWARVELPAGWTRHPYEVEDYCPGCSADDDAPTTATEQDQARAAAQPGGE
jgi:hypothetical protein